MKLSKSKLALAKVINESGGWPDGVYRFATSNYFGDGFYSTQSPSRCGMLWINGFITKLAFSSKSKLPNWHQCVLSREEYHHAYLKAEAEHKKEIKVVIHGDSTAIIGGDTMTAMRRLKDSLVFDVERDGDADGWIEWSGGECPVEKGTLVDVKYANGVTNFGVSALTSKSDDNHKQGTCVSFLATNWGGGLPMSGIVAYRLHKPEVKPEFCESVMRSIPEPEEIFSKGASIKHTPQCRCKVVDVKPTIEQLAQDYRNARDYAVRLQKEADEACAKADSILCKIEHAGEEIGFIMNPIKGD
ncbi:hypothetical protein D3C79_286930 [compost metagenome]